MCYSAQVVANYKEYERLFGASMSVGEFYELFYRRSTEGKVNLPKAMEASFEQPTHDDEKAIADLIAAHKQAQAAKFEQELFEQRKRLADAERSLEIKVTKKALEDQRIATSKVKMRRRWLGDLSRTELEPNDSRIFPDWYAPVLVVENGQRVVKPMRYHCLPAGRPAFFDRKYPGTFNARRDSLESYWKGVFGVSHGIVVTHAFYEHVMRHQAEERALRPEEAEEDVVIEFRPNTAVPMLAACVWSRWTAPGQPDLLSFAAITDEPPAEVAAAGHDRCVIPIKPEHLDAWLSPDPKNLQAQYNILDDRERPYYEHRLAA